MSLCPSNFAHLNLLHESHPGIVRKKALARRYVWWPRIDSDIEKLVKQCFGCQKNQNMPGIAPLHPLKRPSSPWERIHIDFAGPFLDRRFFVLVDAHSKWTEIVEMKTTASTKTIEVPRSIFSRNGIVSDNGSKFSSDEFATFMKRNGFKTYKSAPYHPATNGLAERFIQTFKNSMRAMKDENRHIKQKIAKFLLTYRNTPIPQQMKHQRNFSWDEI